VLIDFLETSIEWPSLLIVRDEDLKMSLEWPRKIDL
jgi:hypothetical protein